jgi:hypothetical protein
VHRGLGAETLVQIVADRVEIGLGARDQMQRAALLGQSFGDGLANAFAGAGDDGGFTVEVEIHDVLPRCSR